MRAGFKVGAAFLILVFIYVVYVAWGDRWAAAEAAEFCGSIAIGADAGQVLTRARASVVPPSRAGGNDQVIFAMFVAPGFIWFRHTCAMRIEEGRVISKAVHRDD